MLIDSSSDEDEDAEPNTESRLAGSAFQETLTSTDGFTRDSRGRVKFNKDTKKRRREADDLGENEDVEMAEEDQEEAKQKTEAEAEKKLGAEAYKARNFEKAATHFSKAWDLYPKDITFLNNLGGK